MVKKYCVKTARKKAGMSQGTLSTLTGISRFNISQSEIGYRKFTNDEIKLVKKVLKGVKNASNKKS